MSTVKRAWLYIIRKKTRSLIMVLILFLIATALISSLTIKQGGAMMEKQMKQNIRSTFTLRQKEQQEHASIEEKTAEAIASSKNIQDRNFLLNGEAKLTEQEFVELPKGNITFNDSEKDPSDKSVRLIGNTDSSLNDSFLNKTMELKDGRHIQKTDENAALIHDSFAKKNHLGVGSEFALTDSTGTIQRMLHVAGIYTGKNEGVPLDTREMVENRIYTDLASAQSLTRQENLITEAVYRVDSPEHLDAVLQNIKSLPLSWDELVTEDNAASYKGVLAAARNMEQMMNTMILGFLLVSVVILSLILIFWIQGRIHETGILLSMGIPKFQIIGQYVIEMMMLAVVSFSFAAVSGSLISRKIGKTIIQTFAFHAGLPELGTAFLLGTGMIVLSVVAASAAIIRLKPKEILSKMS